MSNKYQVIGTPISPYVRKVLILCAHKGLDVAIDPIVPFFGDDEFTRKSPLRRIPVWQDEITTLSDSSVICQYLEERFPQASLLPATPALRAEARWLEEYADSYMGDVMIWKIFNAAVIGPAIFKRPRNVDAITKVAESELLQIFEYLENRLPPQGYFLGEMSLADISIVPFFANLKWSRFAPDQRWPKLVKWLERMREWKVVTQLENLGSELLKTPPAEARAKLASMGITVTPDSHFTPTPRLGPMSVLS